MRTWQDNIWVLLALHFEIPLSIGLVLEKAMAPHENPMDGGTWWAAAHGVTKSPAQLSDFTHFSLSCIGEGNGNPLQYSCLENPRDWGSLVGCRLWGRTESDTTEAT